MTKLAKLVDNTDDLSHDYCLISYQNFDKQDIRNNDPILKLLCGHTFFYDNILKSYKVTNVAGTNYIGKRICPYCKAINSSLYKV